MLRTSKVLIAIIVLIFVITGCSSNVVNNNKDTGSNSKINEPENAPANSGAAEESTSRIIKDSIGDQTIDGTPQRVVVLEWTYAEDVLALGVQPVGAADIENYNKWVNIGTELSSEVVDVGTRQEPNLETIASLEPDLIIAVSFRHKPILDQLNAIAPTL